jgi:large subunit ribosomal protein L21
MLGDDAGVTIGAPIVDGAVVEGTLVETRKGEKIKVFKKIRRQGYRRTGGHRQQETVIRVTSIAGAGLSDKWDGEVDLTPKSVLNARARALKDGAEWQAPASAAPKAPAKKAAAAKAETAKADVIGTDTPVAEAAAMAPVAEAPTDKVKTAPKSKADAADAAPAKAPAKKAAPKAKAPDADTDSDGEDA